MSTITTSDGTEIFEIAFRTAVVYRRIGYGCSAHGLDVGIAA